MLRRRSTVWVGDKKIQGGCDPVASGCVTVVTTALRVGKVVPVDSGVCAGPPWHIPAFQAALIGGGYKHVLSILRDTVALVVLSLIGCCFLDEK